MRPSRSPSPTPDTTELMRVGEFQIETDLRQSAHGYARRKCGRGWHSLLLFGLPVGNEHGHLPGVPEKVSPRLTPVTNGLTAPAVDTNDRAGSAGLEGGGLAGTRTRLTPAGDD